MSEEKGADGGAGPQGQCSLGGLSLRRAHCHPSAQDVTSPFVSSSVIYLPGLLKHLCCLLHLIFHIYVHMPFSSQFSCDDIETLHLIGKCQMVCLYTPGLVKLNLKTAFKSLSPICSTCKQSNRSGLVKLFLNNLNSEVLVTNSVTAAWLCVIRPLGCYVLAICSGWSDSIIPLVCSCSSSG